MPAAPKFTCRAEAGAPRTEPTETAPRDRPAASCPGVHTDEARRVREARWITVLVAVATAALFGLWTAAMLGARMPSGGLPCSESCSPESSCSGSRSCARRAEAL